MPLAVRRGGGGRGGGGGGVQQKALVTQLLADHSTEQEVKVREEEVKEQEVEPRIDQSDLWLVKYDELALKTHNIPLSHLSCCRWRYFHSFILSHFHAFILSYFYTVIHRRI